MRTTRLKFDLSKLKDPKIANEFQANIEGRFGPLLLLEEDTEAITNNFHTVMTETAKDVLGINRPKSKTWVTDCTLDLCDTRRRLKQDKNTTSGRIKYRAINKKIRKEMKKAKQKWIDDQCEEIEHSIAINNTKKAFQIVKDLTKQKRGKISTIQDKVGNCLTEEEDIKNRWTEYCAELYTFQCKGDPSVLRCQEPSNEGDLTILREEVEAAIKTLKCGKAAGVDNIPAELLIQGGKPVSDVLTAICNNIWESGEWPTAWTRSLIITLPKKGNLQLCQNYRTISLISHASEVMLKIILNRLRPQADKIIAEEQAGFSQGRSTIEQIFNLRILCEKHLQHQRNIYHVFIGFKKAFD